MSTKENATLISSYPRLQMGADPEIFLTNLSGTIIGGEKAIPKEGLKAQEGSRTASITLDGVQVELHPAPCTCRVNFGGNLQASFKALRKHLEERKYDAKVSFEGVVEVPKEELEALSDQSKRFGCVESENIYGAPSASLKGINAEEYRIRTAGGHIHIGLPWLKQPTYVPNVIQPEDCPQWYEEYWKQNYPTEPNYVKILKSQYADSYMNVAWWKKSYPKGYIQGNKLDAAQQPIFETPGELDYVHYPPDLWVPAHDILVGNTCVLLDRDPGQVERRKLYGRAGEYRKNPHGYEYRTLSNFWLRSYPLMSLVFGLSRLANAAIYLNNSFERTAIDALINAIDPSKIAKAINENDADLARENWEGVKGWIKKFVQPGVVTINDYALPLDPNTLEDFEFFLSKPLTYWWNRDPLDYWTCPQLTIHTGGGWEGFLLGTVRGARKLAEQAGKDLK